MFESIKKAIDSVSLHFKRKQINATMPPDGILMEVSPLAVAFACITSARAPDDRGVFAGTNNGLVDEKKNLLSVFADELPYHATILDFTQNEAKASSRLWSALENETLNGVYEFERLLKTDSSLTLLTDAVQNYFKQDSLEMAKFFSKLAADRTLKLAHKAMGTRPVLIAKPA